MRGRTMRKLTSMQIETLTTLYYGEAIVSPTIHRTKRGCVLVRDIVDNDGTRITGRCSSLFKRKLIRWRNGPDHETVVLTEAGIKEMEAIDA